MKKFIQKTTAILTSLAMTVLIGVPAFASESAATPSEPIVEERPENENPFIENLLSVYSAGAKNLENGVVLTLLSTVAGVPLSMIPFGALVVVAGIPGGLLMTTIGLGEFAVAPIIAVFMDENTNLEPISGFDAEEILEEVL